MVNEAVHLEELTAKHLAGGGGGSAAGLHQAERPRRVEGLAEFVSDGRNETSLSRTVRALGASLTAARAKGFPETAFERLIHLRRPRPWC